MSWSATPSVSGYQLSPSGGTIDAGLQETVTVNKINGSGTVTVAAPTARNSPQQVTITCTV